MGNRCKILIVDDEHSNIKFITSALEDTYDIFTAINGHLAISQLKDNKPDLILLDVMMPDINGFEVCKIIKANNSYADIPIIFLSALNTDEDVRQGLDAGGIDYLTKPIDLYLLRLRVRNHIESKERNDLVKAQRDLLACQKTELEQSLLCLQKIASRIPGVVYQYRLRPDGSSCFPFASDAIRQIYRVSPEEVMEDASKIYALIHPDDYDDVVASIRKSARELTPWRHEYRVKHPDGTVLWLFGNSVAQRENDGSILWHGFISDISERKQFEDELRQAKEIAVSANAAKSRLLSVVAHEFRTPLGLLSVSVGILDRYRERLSSDKRREQFEQIRNATFQLTQLVDTVLASSRQEMSLPPYFPLKLDIAEACRAIAEEVKMVWCAGHTFTVRITPDCGIRLMAEVLFRRVLSNLLTNAFRFTPPGGAVSLAVSSTADRLLLEVADTGIGISDEEQNMIFEEFYRGGNIEGRRGLGLGLSIVNEAVQLMNGSITVTSAAGVGSRFKVELPISNDTDPAELRA